MSNGYSLGIHLHGESKPTYRVNPDWYSVLKIEDGMSPVDTDIFFSNEEQMTAFIDTLVAMRNEWARIKTEATVKELFKENNA